MKLHRPLVLAVAETLHNIFENGVYADQAVEKLLKGSKRWGSRDRKFLAGSVYGIVRGKRLYESILEEMGFQAPFDYFLLAGVYYCLEGHLIPSWPEWVALEKERIFRAREDFSLRPEILYSIPDWLHHKGMKEYGLEQWEKELKALNEEAAVVIRLNALKGKKEQLISTMFEDGIALKALQTSFVQKHGEQDFAMELAERNNLMNHSTYLSGLFEIQDAGSQLIAPFLNVSPGETVIDACAGGGGKTLHLAALMENKGKIIAMDVHGYKLRNLEKRLQRAGVKIVETKEISEAQIGLLKTRADALLLDVPCSGSGVLRRKADTKWKLKEEELAGLVMLQRKLLLEYATMLKPGGRMVYATCSIFSEENEEQVQWFIQEQGEQFQLIRQKRVHPAEGYDGFFMALLQRGK
jgi:16S rRNA (cytosine967-C5)-methyltransferase